MNKEIQKHNNGGKLTLGQKLKQSGLNISTMSDLSKDLVLPRTFYQLVIFMLDGSNSMNSATADGRSKAVRIEESVQTVLSRLKKSKSKESFDLSFIVFSDDFIDVFDGDIKRLIEIDEKHCFNPLKLIPEPKNTKLANAFKYVREKSEQYLEENSDKTAQVLIMLLSDGAIDDYLDTLKEVNEIKKNTQITLACQYLEQYVEEGSKWYSYNETLDELDYEKSWTIDEVKEDEKRVSDRFKKFSSTDELFITSMDPSLVRDHMIKSITLVSKTNI
jgi:hypothetical protein